MSKGLERIVVVVVLILAVLIVGYFAFFLKAEAPISSDEPSTMTLKIYFVNSFLDPEVSCNKVFAVQREVPRTVAPARAALEALLLGPTQSEKDDGFSSSLNSGVIIQSLTIDGGVARVDFNSKLEEAVGGSCRVTAIRSEITETLKQFSTVDDVVISINGRTEDILQP